MRVVLALLVICLASRAEGQTTRIGGRAGYVWAKQVDDYGVSAALPGATIGVSIAQDFATWIGVHVDALYTQKGWRESSASVRLDYIEFPILMRLAIPLSDVDDALDPGVQPFFVAGPNFAFRIGCSAIGNLPVFESGDRQLFDAQGRPIVRQFATSCSHYRRSRDDSGLAYGGGLTIRRALVHVSVEFRQTIGYDDLRSGPLPWNCTRCTLTSRATSLLLTSSLRLR